MTLLGLHVRNVTQNTAHDIEFSEIASFGNQVLGQTLFYVSTSLTRSIGGRVAHDSVGKWLSNSHQALLTSRLERFANFERRLLVCADDSLSMILGQVTNAGDVFRRVDAVIGLSAPENPDAYISRLKTMASDQDAVSITLMSTSEEHISMRQLQEQLAPVIIQNLQLEGNSLEIVAVIDSHIGCRR